MCKSVGLPLGEYMLNAITMVFGDCRCRVLRKILAANWANIIWLKITLVAGTLIFDLHFSVYGN